MIKPLPFKLRYLPPAPSHLHQSLRPPPPCAAISPKTSDPSSITYPFNPDHRVSPYTRIYTLFFACQAKKVVAIFFAEPKMWIGSYRTEASPRRSMVHPVSPARVRPRARRRLRLAERLAPSAAPRIPPRDLSRRRCALALGSFLYICTPPAALLPILACSNLTNHPSVKSKPYPKSALALIQPA